MGSGYARLGGTGVGDEEVLWGQVEAQGTAGEGIRRRTTSDRSITGRPVTCSGKVEGTLVDDVVLDTGCACTMVRCKFVPQEKLVPGATIQLRCAHGDVVTYPLAMVTLEIDGLTLQVTAAVAEKLLVSVLGTDVPELGMIIDPVSHSQTDVLVVTRAQVKVQTEVAVQAEHKQEQSGVSSNPVGELLPFSTLDEDLFETPRNRPSQTRREKREARHHQGLVRAKDPPKPQPRRTTTVNREQLRQLQETDETLTTVRELADQPSQPFVKKDGLLFRKWEHRTARRRGETSQFCSWFFQETADHVQRNWHTVFPLLDT